MPISKGTKDVDRLFHNNRRIGKVYIDNRLVYEYIEGFIFFSDGVSVLFSDGVMEKCNNQ